MREFEGKVRLHFDRDRGVSIELEDNKSGDNIYVSVDPNYMNWLMAGLSTPCNIEYPDEFHLGKKWESKRVYIDRTWEYNTNQTREGIFEECKKQGVLVDGWKLWQDGLSSKQDVTSGKHKVVLDRYLTGEED